MKVISLLKAEIHSIKIRYAAEEAKSFGLHYVDIGTSGGVEGARYGACLMVGGEKKFMTN